MIRCYITDRRPLGGVEALIHSIARNIAAGVDWIQIREKDLPDRQLADLVRCAVDLAAPSKTRILVNTRFDTALACGAHGVHLPSDSPQPLEFRAIAPPAFLIGVSCHSQSEVVAASEGGAGYVVFGPVFPPRSKVSHMQPTGLDALRRAAASVPIPVLALGGITEDNAARCIAAGASGIAAITLFQS